MNKKIISIVLLLIILTSSLATTVNASASAKVFSNSQSAYYTNNGAYSISGFQTLGYSVTSSLGAITTADMLDWIGNTGNGYGMYVHTYGGSGYFGDYYNSTITTSDISGNWDFVYIDSSYSAATNALASAFHTTGYTNRCFLGWSGNVSTANSTSFNYYFWLTYIGYTSVHLAAVNSAACVPGSGTTPTKLYGSTTYTGAAR